MTNTCAARDRDAERRVPRRNLRIGERAAPNDAPPVLVEDVDAAAVEVGRVEPVRAEREPAEDDALRALVDGDDRFGRPAVRHGRRPGADRPVLAGVDESRRAGGAPAPHDEAFAAGVRRSRSARPRRRPSAPACARRLRRACSRSAPRSQSTRDRSGSTASPHALTSFASRASVTSRVTTNPSARWARRDPDAGNCDDGDADRESQADRSPRLNRFQRADLDRPAFLRRPQRGKRGLEDVQAERAGGSMRPLLADRREHLVEPEPARLRRTERPVLDRLPLAVAVSDADRAAEGVRVRQLQRALRSRARRAR